MTTQELLQAVPGDEDWQKDCWLRNWIFDVQQTLLRLFDGDWSAVERECSLDLYAIRQKRELLQELRRGRVGPCVPIWSGRLYWPMSPRSEDISIDDIAHALAGIGRFNNYHPKNRLPISVAQHGVYVSRKVSPRAELLGLMHDATEAYLHDIISPIKSLLQPAYGALEALCWRAVADRYGIPEDDDAWAEVKAADARALLTEGRDCMPEAGIWLEPPVPVYPDRIVEMSRHDAERTFLERFHELTG